MNRQVIKTTVRVSLTVAIAAVLGGCFVSKVDSQKPELPLPDALPAQAAETSPLPNPWWTLFNDARLNELMVEALGHNPDAQIAAARVMEARSFLRIANADRVPTVNLEGNATRSKQSEASLAQQGFGNIPGFPTHQTLYTVQGTVAYELDLWGKYQRASESARAQLLNSEYGREATKLSLTGEVARVYFSLIAAAEQLARGRDTLRSREESMDLEKLRFDSGESDEFTFKRAEADAAATRVSTRQLELQVVQLTNALGVLLGRSPKALVDEAVSVQGVSLPAPVQLPAALPSSVMAQRPDIGAAEAALNASAADIGVARAQLFPSISITGAFGSISPELDDLFTGPSKAWTATGGILQPLFQGGRLRANVSRAEAVREQRKAEYARTVQQAFREVLDTLQGQTLIAGVREANDQQVAALSRATELAELRYDQGDIAYLELLDVRRGLYQAQIDLVAAQRDALLNAVDLALAVGGGLGDQAEPLTARR
ncbi:efflux transporter outer membrane subunit [Steroidobacter sp. S1-65]|uniref:Efflux transporter outer membrane subunit n=1 Tax=Steroidobacter gossypii TaxID=2805490 RepID=A0ABS1X6H6_9GAMM|nr:efflux transporter outer membrane subunit [Steroidobacter gossypii]MBM0108830.1 efflux transporter outer membrane subunit [Steroidobacter gossypii]